MKSKLSIKAFAKQSSVETINTNQLKDIKGGGGPQNIPPGLLNMPSQAQGCPPPLDNFS